jgi:hypothetical protein
MELAWAIKDEPATLHEPVILLPFHAIDYDPPPAATPCPIGHAFAVRAENGIPDRVIFLPFHAIHYHQLREATLCRISDAFAVRAYSKTRGECARVELPQ